MCQADDEISTWLMKLSTRDAARTRFYLQLLTEHGNALAMPHARSLGAAYVQRQNERRRVERAHNGLKQVQQEFDT